jgi:hypothetical protein
MNMPPRSVHLAAALAAFLGSLTWPGAPARGDDVVGRIKLSRGAVHVERGGQRVPAPVGAEVRQADVVVTGADGAVGIVFLDASLLSAGPRTSLAIDRFVFDSTTNQGRFDTSLKKGTLAVVSGKIAQQSPGAMRVTTPAAILGVRGTELVVRADD